MLDQRVDAASSPLPDPVPRPGSVPRSSVSAVSAPSMIGKTIFIKGEITGAESVHIDGTLEGSIALPADRVTVGASGRVSADISAQDIVVHGEVTGSCSATDHLYVRREGSLCGDIVTARVSVEEGAYLTGSIDIQRQPPSALSTTEQELVEPAQVN